MPHVRRSRLVANTNCGTRPARTIMCHSSSSPVMSLDILQQATSLNRLAQILDECSAVTADPQVAAVAIDKLAMMGADITTGSAEAFKLLGMEFRVQVLCESAAIAMKAHEGKSDISFHVLTDALVGLTELSRTFDSLSDHPGVQVSLPILLNFAGWLNISILGWMVFAGVRKCLGPCWHAELEYMEGCR